MDTYLGESSTSLSSARDVSLWEIRDLFNCQSRTDKNYHLMTTEDEDTHQAGLFL